MSAQLTAHGIIGGNIQGVIILSLQYWVPGSILITWVQVCFLRNRQLHLTPLYSSGGLPCESHLGGGSTFSDTPLVKCEMFFPLLKFKTHHISIFVKVHLIVSLNECVNNAGF